jgi:acetyl-CoA acetyltransferase family protein
LGAAVVDALVERSGVPPHAVDDVIIGCVSQIGAQSGNIGRSVVLSSRVLPLSVPGTAVDRQCGSSQQALHFAVQGVASGTADVIIAGGVECMSSIPIGSSIMDGVAAGRGQPKGEVMEEKWPGVVFSQFEGAEMLAAKAGVTREEMEQLAVASHARAVTATKEGRFADEIVPLQGIAKKTGEAIRHATDEGIRPSTTATGLAKLKTLKPDGLLTAGTASQIADGASAVLICNARALKRYGLKPRARIVALALAGDDPVVMLGGPIPATRNVLQRAGMTIDQIDLYEVNEAFASVPLAWAKALGADISRLNVNGGAMALGHPLGATGTKLFTTLVNELHRRRARYGLVAICEGGGTANATIIERIDDREATILASGGGAKL